VTSSGRAALALYEGLGASTRLHVLVRWASCPFPRIAEEIPAAGRVLEVGCGHGLFSTFLALQSHRRQVHGVDLDADKIDKARVAADRAGRQGADVSFDLAPSGEVPPGPWAAITIVDVLYLLEPAEQRRLIADCARQLAPGGVLVVKEMSSSPRWKFRWNTVQELISVRVLRITEGAEMAFLGTDELVAAMSSSGLEVTASRRIDRGRPHPHHLVVARAPESPSPG
jgi:2-polyprenyl-3-methyl-5-hydroxy-6-metoxy-1,4-benzoquinol methylase